ncbi:ADP-heptose--LPS heptosyltransferase 2 [bacterium BMS3Bbin14]|nr:ADP-heptose--LPS heptosyltransferase 2 [bacterium BMS3Abin13]GBE51837.1 ADP-heptose--LPS heptosyltransferase 2 [bacterium BMS3Bbin14]HDK43985.1 lipopolysaccharide heptosyltransferase II [Desulfobacteraceae bacterium]HDL98290.1 lipopolysaccharide heptosyltransferase II [Desulfobacteraceae bacterium]HDO30471.1 lipopolysaccharide heptosyltransferase II [Desulfobacteraceae bacterium]
MRSLLPGDLKKILIRSTNWIGDAIMTTPAVRTVRRNFPAAEITLLAMPWVADVFRASPDIDRIIHYEKNGRHHGLAGKMRLALDLKRESFEAAVLLQNAFEAALITSLARIPVRGGYTTDGRGLLLTHGVKKQADIGRRHQVHYYQEMLRGLGLRPGPDDLELVLPDSASRWAGEFLQEKGLEPGALIIGLNPGAAYGPAKRWPSNKFAALAAELCRKTEALVLIFGTEADCAVAERIGIEAAAGARIVNLAGRTSLSQAMALIGRCTVFVTNDSGLMHVSAALHTRTVAIFGSTDPVATGPASDHAIVVRTEIACSPCLKTHCPKQHFQCMEKIKVEDVLTAVYEHLGGRAGAKE